MRGMKKMKKMTQDKQNYGPKRCERCGDIKDEDDLDPSFGKYLCRECEREIDEMDE